jgi:NADH dehydrogenase
MENKVKKIVVVGGGFGGINLLKELANDKRFQVTLVDKNNYHFFPPLLYQVGTAFIEPSSISYPFRRFFQDKLNIRFHLGGLTAVNPAQNTVETETGTIPYDYLVLALGTESNFFGMENVKNNSLTLKTIDEATTLRNHLLINMEQAVRATDATEKSRYMNIVIAGGGPTGVEVAGMLAEMGKHIAPKEYPELDISQQNIYLVEAGAVLLGPMSKKSQEETLLVVKDLGVKVLLNTAVKDYVDGSVVLSNGEKISTNTLIWTSGVIGREVKGLPADAIGRGRRILVDETNKVKGTENIFAIGDICLQTSDKNYPDGHPQLAQVAIQQGILLAKNLQSAATGKSFQPFSYYNKGSMAIITKYKAVVDLPNSFVKGFIAWVLWLVVHIMPIAGFRNKVWLIFSWLWAFVTNNPTLRIIIRAKEGGEK